MADKSSPGPFYAEQDGGAWYVCAADHTRIADLFTDSTVRQAVDARLLAASFDLRNALRALVESRSVGYAPPDDDPRMQAARSALAKAAI